MHRRNETLNWMNDAPSHCRRWCWDARLPISQRSGFRQRQAAHTAPAKCMLHTGLCNFLALGDKWTWTFCVHVTIIKINCPMCACIDLNGTCSVASLLCSATAVSTPRIIHRFAVIFFLRSFGDYIIRALHRFVPAKEAGVLRAHWKASLSSHASHFAQRFMRLTWLPRTGDRLSIYNTSIVDNTGRRETQAGRGGDKKIKLKSNRWNMNAQSSFTKNE